MSDHFRGPSDSSRRRLAVFFFHPTIERGGVAYVKPHHGKFFDEIATHYDELALVAPYYREPHLPGWMVSAGNYYDHRPRTRSIRLVEVRPERWAYPLRLFAYLRWLLRADEVLFFTPLVASIVLAPLLWLLGKPYYCYVAVDVRRHYRERFGAWVGGAVGWAQSRVIGRARGVLATGTHNLNAWQGRTRTERVTPLLDITLPPAPLLNTERRGALFVGVITPRKRLERALEVVAALRAQGVELEFSIAGNVSDRELDYQRVLQAQAQALGIADRVRWLGYVSDPAQLGRLLAESEFLFLFSSFEGFPKVVYEAMAFGAIPVLSPLDSYDGMLEDGTHAIFDAGGDASQLATRLRGLLSAEAAPELERLRRTNHARVAAIVARTPGSQFVDLTRA